MREYGQIQSTYWTHPDIRGLSDPGKLLGAYLLSGPHTTGLGVFYMPDGYVMADFGWIQETVTKGFEELFRIGFARRCETTYWVLIEHFLRWNPISNPNIAKSRKLEFSTIPQSFCYFSELAFSMLQYGKHWDKGFETLLQTLSKQDPTRPDPTRDNPKGTTTPSSLQNSTEVPPAKNTAPPANIPPAKDDQASFELDSPQPNDHVTQQLVNAVFSDWQRILNHPQAKLGKKRIEAIRNALKTGYQRNEIADAFAGCSRSSYHMKLSVSGKLYDDIDLILRNEQNIDRFREYKNNPPKPTWRTGETPGPRLAREAREFWENACRNASAESRDNPADVFIDGKTGHVVPIHGNRVTA